MTDGCQGTLRVVVRTSGVRAHSARSWLGVNAIHAAAPVLARLAAEVGLDESEFGAALRDRRYMEAHRRALRHAAEEAGVTGVPRFVIGRRRLTGVQDRDTLAAVITAEQVAGGSA